MTISTIYEPVSFACNGVTVAFALPHQVDSADDLIVILTDSTGADSALSDTLYTVAGIGNDAGVTVTTDTAYATGNTITLTIDPALTQSTHFQPLGIFPAEDAEVSLDRLTRIAQVLRAKVNRSLRAPDNDDELPELPSATLRGAGTGTVLGFAASTGDPELRTDYPATTFSQSVFNTYQATSDPYKRTAAEIAAGMTPVNHAYPPGDSRRWNVTSNGSTNDATALQNWITASAADRVIARLHRISGNAMCGTQLSIPSNLVMEIPAGAAIQSTIDDTPIMKGLGVSNVKIYGDGSIVGYGGTTDWPSPTSNSEGLIHFNVNGATRCENIKIFDITITDTWCPISIIKADKVWVQRVGIEEFMRYGILAPSCTDFHIDDNVIYKSNVTSANAYGIMATGDDAGGFAQERCTITGNKIRRVRAWDGIMSHDVKKLTCANNIIEDCRSGIDLGHLVSTNVVEDLIVTGNQVTLTTTDAWSGSAAAHFGIALAGYDATHRIARAVCANNIVNNHGNIAGATYAGDPGSCVFSYADNLAVTGNVIANADNDVASVPGMQFIGTMNNVTVTGNPISGDMPSGGLKFTNVICNVLAITGNAITQTTNTNNAILFLGSTISSLAIGDNPTNCTTPIAAGTSTLTYSGTGAYRVVVNQAVANLTTTASRQDTFTLANVVPGDSVSVTLPANWPAGLISSAPIAGTGQVYLQFHNPTGGTLSMAADNFYFEIKKYV